MGLEGLEQLEEKVDLITTYTQGLYTQDHIPRVSPPGCWGGKLSSSSSYYDISPALHQTLRVGLDACFQHMLDYLFPLHWGPKEYYSFQLTQIQPPPFHAGWPIIFCISLHVLIFRRQPSQRTSEEPTVCGPGMASRVPYVFFESKQQHREFENLQDTETEAQGDKNPHRSQNLPNT